MLIRGEIKHVQLLLIPSLLLSAVTRAWADPMPDAPAGTTAPQQDFGDIIGTGARDDVFAQGGYAYVTNYERQGHLIVLDMSDPAHPREASSLTTPGQSKSVFVANNAAYIADGDAGLRIIDVSDPTHPIELGHLAPPEGTSSHTIFVKGTTAYLGSNGASRAWVQKIDVSDPAHPQVTSTFQQPSPKQVQFTVAIPEDALQVDWVVNVWFDWDRNGAWGNVPSCNGEEAPEWAVQNLRLGKLTPGLPHFPDTIPPLQSRSHQTDVDAYYPE
ncbi:MAG: hypothetical protein J7M34_13345 [Anaerolineae bacterium]|nr:hypothetical protein [Anaerolineae bacterium]